MAHSASTRAIPVSSSVTSPQRSSHPQSNDNGNYSFNLASILKYLDQTRRNADIHVLSPIQTIFKDAFKNYPATTSYVVLFSGLSLLPILSFLGFSLLVGSILIGLSSIFVFTWGSIILGSALFVLLTSLGFLAIATFWIVIGSVSTIFILRSIYNLQHAILIKAQDIQIGRDSSHCKQEKTSQKLHQSQGEADEKPQKLMNGQHSSSKDSHGNL